MAGSWLRLGRESAGGVHGQLRRNGSLAPRHLLGVYLSLVMLSLVISAGFWWNGAPLVLPFASAELLVLGVAMLAYARHTRFVRPELRAQLAGLRWALRRP